MKKFTFISGAFFSSLTLIGVLFKIQYWVGGSIFIILGIAGIAFLFIPAYAIYKYNKDN